MASPMMGSWVQYSQLSASDPALYDNFGHSVAMDGNTIVAGVPYDDTGPYADAGSVYVYTRTGDRWRQQDHLVASDGQAQDWFGYAVSISGDTIVVGAYGDDAKGSQSGSAYVFIRSGGSWSQQDHLVADDGTMNDGFGNSVAISGDTIVVGAAADSTGAASQAGSAYVFVRTGSSWIQQDHLVAADAETDDWFGTSVAIDRDSIVVGAPGEDTGGVLAGSAYVFARTSGTRSQQKQLFAPDTQPVDRFGHSVAISGQIIVVGAYADDTSAGNDTGSAYVFGAWGEQDHLVVDDAESGDHAAYSVAIDGDRIVVGTPSDDTAAGSRAGSAYVFARTDGVWSQQGHLFADGAASDDRLGNSVAISGDNIVVGASFHNDRTGMAAVFRPSFGIFVAEPDSPAGR
jgi:hypothetical protein